MAKGKFALTVSPVKIEPTLSKDTLYLDSAKADPIIADMINQFNICRDSLRDIQVLLNKIVKSAGVKKTLQTDLTLLANKCKIMATYSNNRVTGLKSKYDADTKEFTIQLLTSRLDELERRINAMTDSQ